MNWNDLLMAHGLSLGTTIVAGSVAWGKIHERIKSNHERHGERISELEARCEHYDKFAERFASLGTDIRWIKDGLRELREKGGSGQVRRDGRGDADNSTND